MSKKSDLIIHPVRLRLVAEMGNRQMTTRELADALPDIPQATLYRQIKRLHEGDIFHVVSEQMVNGSVERTYTLTTQQNRLTEEELAELTAEQHMHYFSVFAAALIDSFGRYVAQNGTAGFVEDGMSYSQAVIYVSDEERQALQGQLMGLIGPLLGNQPTAERKRYTLASVVIPDERSDE